MKLLMITGLGSARDLVSGKKGAFYNTLDEFHKYWERIDIISPGVSRNSTLKNLEIESLFGNVYIHISPWPLMFHPFWFLKKGLEIYKEQKFDLMTVHEFPPFYNGIGARLLWNKIKVPYILEIHHIPGYPRAAGAKEKIYKNLMRVFIKFDAKKAKAVRVVNQNQTPKFLIESGVPREKIIYIPSLYIDLEIFKPMNLPKEYDLIFIGRLEKNKGLDLLLEAFQILNTKYLIHNLRLLIVGDGPERKNLEFLFRQSFSRQANIKDNEFKKNVIMRGYVKDQREIAELINKSKILVMPSYNEGGPRVVVEAMACGVPVLATSVGIVPDIIKFKSGGAIQIIDWKAEDIAKKAFELLHDRDKNQMYILAGFKIAYQFEKKAMIQNYADKLKGLC